MEYSENNIKEVSSQDRLLVEDTLNAIEGKKEFIPEKIKERLYFLVQTPFFLHSTEIGHAFDNFALFVPDSFTQSIPRSSYINARYAAIFHDIGKTGTPHSTFVAQKSVMSIYSMGHIEDKSRAVHSLLVDTYGQERALEIMKQLQSCHINSQISFQDFINLHSVWTKNILDVYWSDQLSHTSDEEIKTVNEIITIASSHHVDQGINPCNIPFENNEEFPPLVLLMVILDKTNASYRRGGLSLEDSLTRTRIAIGRRFPYYKYYINGYFKHLGNMANQGDFFKASFGK